MSRQRPGGNSTIDLSFGEEKKEAEAPKMVWNRRKQQWVPATEENAEEKEKAEEEEKEELQTTPSYVAASAPLIHVPPPKQLTSANAYASGNNQNSGNFITDKPTTRVRAPPGGASTISFG